MNRVIIVYSRFYNFDSRTFELGGVETYIRNLIQVASTVGLEPHVIFGANEEHEATLDNGTHLHGIVIGEGDVGATLIKSAVVIGNPERDLLVFGSSTLIRKSPFKHSLAIQHGIYWDVETIHGRSVSDRVASTALRAIQAKRQLEAHSLVSQMVCVDLNYVNWMRALSVANRLPYRYIPNFADTNRPMPERPDDGKVRIVFARRFEPIRGCGLLMEVMPQVLAEHPEVELAVAGGGSMETELHVMFAGNPRVTFTRYDAAESIAFHGQFDIALVPSVASEGTSLSLLEAMAAGCAVVATDVGGMSDIVLDGHNGLLVRPEAAELRRGLELLIGDAALRRRLACNARQTVEDSFSRDRWAKSWSEVLGQYV